jgi:hypothetical protein
MKLLILNNSILAAGEFTETDAEIQTSDAIYPKHVIEGYQILDIDVPEGFTPQGYEYQNGAIVAKPIIAPKPEVPQSISMRQARLALLAADLLDDVDTMIKAIGRAAAITWEFATEVERTNELIAAVQEAKGLTDEQIDEMFIAASKL